MRMRVILVAMVMVAGCAERSLTAPAEATAPVTLSAEHLFEANCAACHGAPALAASAFDVRHASDYRDQLREWLTTDDKLTIHPTKLTSEEWSTLMVWSDG
jgi:mono/diheme cytochrome c family protein